MDKATELHFMKEELRVYDVSFILDTRNWEDSIEALIDSVKKVMESIGGKVLDSKNLGVKSFVRVTDRKFPQGHYVTFRIEGDGNFPKDLKGKLKLNRNVNRLMVEKIKL